MSTERNVPDVWIGVRHIVRKEKDQPDAVGEMGVRTEWEA